MPNVENDALRHMPCDMGCQPDWHHDDCAIYLPADPPLSVEDDAASCSSRDDHDLPAENDAPFYWNTDTGEPCPRRGNVLCALPWSPDHRHTHREPPLTLTVEHGAEPVSALGSSCECESSADCPASRPIPPTADQGASDV